MIFFILYSELCLWFVICKMYKSYTLHIQAWHTKMFETNVFIVILETRRNKVLFVICGINKLCVFFL